MRAILSFSSPWCAIIVRLNVICTKFRRAMIARLNKIWRVCACARAIARHSRPGLIMVTTKKLLRIESYFDLLESKIV